jgi:hypothetical protein
VGPQSKWESDEVKMQHRIVENGIEEGGTPLFPMDGEKFNHGEYSFSHFIWFV